MLINNIKSLIKTVITRPFLAKVIVMFLLELHNFSYKGIGFLSQYLEPDSLHPKHRIMKYHDWFTKHLNSNWFVLDIGCGNGALTSDIGLVARKVVGLDIEENNIKIARESYHAGNIEFVCGDITSYFFDFKVDCVVLSNVLEHIEDRGELLERLKRISERFLIRVPMFNRDWLTHYKKEMGVEWRLDKTHYTEYTRESFHEEMAKVGMVVAKQEIMWGEIYAVVEAEKDESNKSGFDSLKQSLI